jgi:6-phosphofructokinase
MMKIIIILMGHECTWGTIWGGQQEGRERRILTIEEHVSMQIYAYGDSIMKPPHTV